MLPKNLVFKSFLPPGLTEINGIMYVVPGWHVVPNDTTLEEVHNHWIQDKPNVITSHNPTSKIETEITSTRSGEKYQVIFNGINWSCTCMGFGFRKQCKHISQVKQQYI